MSSPVIVEVLEIVSVNEFQKKPDARGVSEMVRFVNLKCDGFSLNVRAPLSLEIPVGYSAKALIDCVPFSYVSRDRSRMVFLPSSLIKLKIGNKVEKIDILSDFLSAPVGGSSLKK